MAAYVSYLVGKGEARTFLGTHQKSEKDKTAQDITGWTGVVTAKKVDGTVAFSKPITIISGPDGTYSWPVTNADTNIAPQVLDIDIWRTNVGFEWEMAAGKFVIGPDVLYGP